MFYFAFTWCLFMRLLMFIYDIRCVWHFIDIYLTSLWKLIWQCIYDYGTMHFVYSVYCRIVWHFILNYVTFCVDLCDICNNLKKYYKIGRQVHTDNYASIKYTLYQYTLLYNTSYSVSDKYNMFIYIIN